MLRTENFPQGGVPHFVSIILTIGVIMVMVVIEIASNGLPLKDLHEQAQYIL